MNLDTPRAKAILSTIQGIPLGRLSSYGAIAEAAGYKGNARYVGQLLKNLPPESSIPWHRVIASQGKIAFPENSEAYYRQRALLDKENHPTHLTKTYLNSVIWPTKL